MGQGNDRQQIEHYLTRDCVATVSHPTSFIYMWYVAETKKFYLGKSNGLNNYTHSSLVEEFCKYVPNYNEGTLSSRKKILENPPKGIKRRILCYGSDEEITELEIKLLTNRKEKGKWKWEQYYNIKWNTVAIGSLYNHLSEEGIAKWKKNTSKALKGKPKSKRMKRRLKRHMSSLSQEQRNEIYGHQGEKNHKWKGGISIGDNKKQYYKNDYQRRKKLCFDLIEQGLSYYEIKEKHRNALVAYPYPLLPKEEKERKNKLNLARYHRSKHE